MKPAIRIATAGAALLAGAPRVLAQGCAMCYTEAAAQSPGAARQLDLAILTLLVPSVLMFAGVLVAAFRRRDSDLAADEPGVRSYDSVLRNSVRNPARLSPDVSSASWVPRSNSLR